MGNTDCDPLTQSVTVFRFASARNRVLVELPPPSSVTISITTSLLTMQHPRSLVLLGAASSLAAVAAGSLPRGVGPECKFLCLHPIDGSWRFYFYLPASRDSIRHLSAGPIANRHRRSCLPLPRQDRVQLHLGCIHRAELRPGE